MRQTQVSMRSHFQQDKPIMRILTGNYSFHQQQSRNIPHICCAQASVRFATHVQKNGGGNVDDFLDSISPSPDILGGHMVYSTHTQLSEDNKQKHNG